MKFSELQLEVAIYKADIHFDPLTQDQQKELAKRVFATWVEEFDSSVFAFEIDDIAAAKARMRKASGKVRPFEIAIHHDQWRCFWHNRGKGPCNDDVEAGHIVARANGAGDLTIENAMIECRARQQPATNTFD